jgi:hypothetical protein
MSYRRRYRVNAKGRSDMIEQYIKLPYPTIRSPAWRSLSGQAVKVWCELRCRFNGGNNGKISLSLDEAARILGIGKATAQRALRELEAKGFIVTKRKGQWYGRLATLWRLTDKDCDGHPPTFDWKQWRPGQNLEIGSNMVPKTTATDPAQNRSPKIGIDLEPVRPHLGTFMGSEMDR